jgi:hypothetical protein
VTPYRLGPGGETIEQKGGIMIDLNLQLEVWVGDGIITDEQAEMMRRSVALPEPLPEPEEVEGRIPIITEILGYVGAALAIWAVFFLVSEFWGKLSDWAQASLFGALALALFAAGTALRDVMEPALSRLSGVLWAGSIVALGGTLFMLFDPMAGLEPEVVWTLIGAIASVVAGVMFVRRPSVAQHTMLFAAVLTMLVSLLTLGPDAEIFFFGLVVWGYGLVWILVTRSGILRPLSSGMVLGAIAMLIGAQMTVGDGTMADVGTLLGLATAGLLAGAGVMLKEKLTIILGGVGIFWFVPQAMFHFFGEAMGGMFGLFVSGLLLIGLAIWFGRHREAL